MFFWGVGWGVASLSGSHMVLQEKEWVAISFVICTQISGKTVFHSRSAVCVSLMSQIFKMTDTSRTMTGSRAKQNCQI